MALAAALAACLAGCANPDPPAPRPLRVNPDRGAASQAVAVVISGADLAASTNTDFEGRDPSTLDARFQASLDATPLRDVRLHADGTLTATVPEGIPVGLHDLVVVSPEGREGRLEAAYRALADAEIDRLVASYRIDPLGPQQAWAPFAVTITALDPAGSPIAGYDGAVTLSDLTGTAVPGAPALFRNGVWSGTVEIRAAHAADVLSVEDALGNRGASAPFAVAPTPAAALRFTTPPRSTVAGACSGAAQPLTVEVTDAFGLPTVAAGALALTPAAGPGLELFGDDACTMPLAAPAITAGSGSLTVWYRSTRAGTATVELAAAALTPASQVQTVVAGPPARVAFVSAPQLIPAGSCSLAATVEVRDAWDNPALGGAVAVALSGAPASGFELFSDAACTTAASGVSSAVATARADFWFRGNGAGSVTVDAGATGLTGSSQVETIAPAAPDRLVFSTSAQTVAAGACSAAATVRLEDPYGNVSSLPTARTVNLGATPGGGFAFFSDASCSTAVSSVIVPMGASEASFHFRGTRDGAYAVTASAAGLASASQVETILPAAPDRLVFDSAAQTVPAGSCSAAAVVRTKDVHGNFAPVIADTVVALGASPAAGFTFFSDASCSATVTSVTLVAGTSQASFWFRGDVAGTVTVTASVSGWTAPTQDEVVVAGGVPSRSPPTAHLTASPAAAVTGQSVIFDASGSEDYQTPTADLMVSWDLTGAATAGPAWPTPASPWSAWTTLKTATTSFSSTGAKTVRVAVRDADGDVGYAVVTVRVVTSTGNGYCVVDTNADGSDGATGCGTGARGADGKLSLQEALSNVSQDGVITFASPMTLTGTGSYSVPRRVSIVGYGVVVAGKGFSFTDGTTANPTRVIGLELTGQPSPITPPAGKVIIFEDVYVHDSAGFETWGYLRLERVRMENCTSACVTIQDTSSSGWLTVRASEFRNAGSGTAIYAAHADGGPPTLNATTSFFAGFQRAIWIATSGATTIVNNTFEANGTGIQYQGSTGHVLRNNVFSNQTVAAAILGTATFTNRDYHLLWQNAADGLLASDPNVLTTDPLFLYPAAGDYRLSLGSPAIDSGIDIGINLLPAFPTSTPRYLGTAPDRGGYETW